MAYSLRGLVCAEACGFELKRVEANGEDQALVKVSSLSGQPAHTIADCAHGIVFLGTPHQSSDKAKWAAVGNRMLSLFGHDSSKVGEIGENLP